MAAVAGEGQMRIAIISPYQAWLYLPHRSISLWSSHGRVRELVEVLLLPHTEHGDLTAYNRVAAAAEECTEWVEHTDVRDLA